LRWTPVPTTPTRPAEFAPEGRLGVRQVVHGLHQRGLHQVGRAIPRLAAITVAISTGSEVTPELCGCPGDDPNGVIIELGRYPCRVDKRALAMSRR
jgi:hypothetical protein